MTTYPQVLRLPEMKAVFAAHAVSLSGTVAAEVALSVLVFQLTSSAFLSAMTLACGFVPQAFSALILSGHVDRVPPRRLLVTCDLVCAGLVTLMVVPSAPVWSLLLLAGLIGLLTPLFGGARAAVLADVLDADAFVAARSLLRLVSQSSLLIGFAVGGAVLTLVGPRALLTADALSFVASAALLRWGTSAHPARRAGQRLSLLDGLRATRATLSTPVLRRLLLLTWLPAALYCSVDALATPYTDGQGGQVALLLASAALGTIGAEWVGLRLRIADRPQLRLPLGLVAGGALLLYAGHPPVQVAALLNVVGALGGAIGQWVDRQLVANLPEDVRGQFFSLQGGLLMAVQGVGIALAGALAEVFPAYMVLAGAGALSILTWIVLLRPQRAEDRHHQLDVEPATAD